MMETHDRRVYVCDGCCCWTDTEVTRDELLADWGWENGADEDGYYPAPLYCPECQ